MEQDAGAISRGTRGNAFPIVEKLPERDRVGTPFPLLKCLRTHCRRHFELFPAKNALDCAILHIQSSFFFRRQYHRGPDLRSERPDAWTRTPISA